MPKDWRLGYRDVTHPESQAPGRTGLGTMLTAMPLSGDRAVLAPCCDFCTIRLGQIAEDHTIGKVLGGAGLLALVLERHLDGKADCAADTGLRDSRADDRYLLRSDRLGPVAGDRPHFMYKF